MNDFSDLVLTFTSEELAEHNKQIRAEAIDECIKMTTDERLCQIFEQLKE